MTGHRSIHNSCDFLRGMGLVIVSRRPPGGVSYLSKSTGKGITCRRRWRLPMPSISDGEIALAGES